MCQAGVHRQYPYLLHLYNIRFWLLTARRGREQGGADGLRVITAQDEREETMGGGGGGGRRGCQMDDG